MIRIFCSSEIGVTRILQEFVVGKRQMTAELFWISLRIPFEISVGNVADNEKWKNSIKTHNFQVSKLSRNIFTVTVFFWFFHQLKYLKTAMKAKETIFFCHFVVIFSLSLDSCDCVEFVCEVATTTIIYAMWRLGYPNLKEINYLHGLVKFPDLKYRVG